MEDAATIKIDGAAGLDAAIEKRNIEEKQAGFDSIVELRQKQEELVTLIAKSPSNSFTEGLATESAKIQKEITRVATDATDDNGNNLFTGAAKIVSKGGGGSQAAKATSYDLAANLKSTLSGQDDAVDFLDDIKALDPIEASHRVNLLFDTAKVDTEIATASKEAEQAAAQAQTDTNSSETASINVAAQLGINAYSQQQELASLLSTSLKVKTSEESQSATIA